MATVVKRERPMFWDLLDWFDDDFRMFPMVRPFAGTQVMRIEDYVEDGAYVLRAELPGIDPDKDVEITIGDGVLRVKAQREEARRETHRSEFHYGSLSRSVTLPATADDDDVTATYRHGVLEIRIGLTDEKKQDVKHIPIGDG